MLKKDKISRVLLVDDDKINNFINERLIRRLGLAEEINTVYNGQEALDYLEQLYHSGEEIPSLILLDINMPVMDGFEFMEAVSDKKYFSDTRSVIFMLTTSVNANDIERARKSQVAKGYINKPLTEKELKEKLGEFFQL